jgi:DNA repair protein RadC
MLKGIKEWPENERPRKKLLKRGSESLTDAEFLALTLRTGYAVHGRSAQDVGQELLQLFGNLRFLAVTPVAKICRPGGPGQLKAVLELAGRMKTKRLQSGY